MIAIVSFHAFSQYGTGKAHNEDAMLLDALTSTKAAFGSGKSQNVNWLRHKLTHASRYLNLPPTERFKQEQTMSKMTEIVAIVWSECVGRRPAPDDATMERWQSDIFAKYQEYFRIRPLPAQHETLVNAALAEWATTENNLLTRLAMSQAQFDSQFPPLREGFLAGDAKAKKDGAILGNVVRGAVCNMDMINCFAFFLPRAVPDRRIELAQTGRRITAVFYLEQMYKAAALGMSHTAQGLERVDAMWRFAHSLCDWGRSVAKQMTTAK